MKTLQITDTNARQMYKTATAEIKAMLEDTFGKEFFSGKIIDRIKTYEDACAELGESPVDENLLKTAGFTPDEIAYRKIKTITQALNEGWKPDWNDSNQHKWFPWYKLSSSGFVFYATVYSCSGARAGNGSRLCFQSDELATYAGKQFIDLYKSFIL